MFDLNDFDFVKYVKPIEIILKIESDTKLISNLESLKNQKYLFCYELGKMIAKSHNLLVFPTPSYVDIFFNGYIFRVIVAFKKEISIIREMANKLKVVKVL